MEAAIAARWPGVSLGEAVGPAGGGAIGGRGVDHPRAGLLDQADGFARRVVGQAQDHRVGGVQQLGAGGRVLARGPGRWRSGEVVAAFQPLADLQAGGAGFAVDEDLGAIGSLRN